MGLCFAASAQAMHLMDMLGDLKGKPEGVEKRNHESEKRSGGLEESSHGPDNAFGKRNSRQQQQFIASFMKRAFDDMSFLKRAHDDSPYMKKSESDIPREVEELKSSTKAQEEELELLEDALKREEKRDYDMWEKRGSDRHSSRVMYKRGGEMDPLKLLDQIYQKAKNNYRSKLQQRSADESLGEVLKRSMDALSL